MAKTQLWRAVVLYRVITLLYAAGVMVHNYSKFSHPGGAVGVLLVLAAWTAATSVLYLKQTAHPALIAADVAVAVAAVLATRVVATDAHIVHDTATLPTAWAAAPVLAAAVAGGVPAGAAAGIVVAAADVAERAAFSLGTINSVVLLLIVGLLGGYVTRLVEKADHASREAAHQEAVAAGLRAASAERNRLAADIHDSVLQILALISRQARGLGGEAEKLGRMAGEQEEALRSLIAHPVAGDHPDGAVDLRPLLPDKGDRLHVAVPATPVLLPETTAGLVAGAVEAAVANVTAHAGADASAWVFVEDEISTVTVNVRDNGVGFGAGRLQAASRAGRLGVQRSILGRIRSVGGEASIDSTPGKGTEVKLRVPRS